MRSACRQFSQQVGLHEHHGDLRVFEHVRQALLRVGRIERHVGATGLEHRQQSHHHLDRALGEHAHQHLGAHPARLQHVRKLVGAGVEFGVGELAVLEHECHRMGRALDLLLEELVDATAAEIVYSGVVPFHEQLMALARAEHRQLIDGLRGVGRNAFEQRGEVPGHAIDGGSVKQLHGVDKLAVQLAAVLGEQQRKLERRHGRRSFDPLCCRPIRIDCSCRRCAQLEVHLMQRSAARFVLRLEPGQQLVEGHFPMGKRIERRLANLPQELDERRVAPHVGSQRQGAVNAAGQSLAAAAQATRRGNSHGQVVLARMSRQQDLERCQQQHEQRRSFIVSQAFDRLDQRPGQDEAFERAMVIQARRPGPVGGQLERLQTRQLRTPVLQRRVQRFGCRVPGLWLRWSLEAGVVTRQCLGQACHRGCLEQCAHRGVHVQRRLNARDEAHRQQRVPAQIEEIVIDTKLRNAEQFAPDGGQRVFQRCARYGAVAWLRAVGWRQRLAVHLAVGQQRHRIEEHAPGRHQGGGQLALEVISQLRGRG